MSRKFEFKPGLEFPSTPRVGEAWLADWQGREITPFEAVELIAEQDRVIEALREYALEDAYELAFIAAGCPFAGEWDADGARKRVTAEVDALIEAARLPENPEPGR